MSYANRLEYSRTINSSCARKKPKRKLKKNLSQHSLNLQNFENADPNNTKELNLFSQMINGNTNSNTGNSFNSYANSSMSLSKNSIPMNLEKLEGMIEDMNENIYCRMEKNQTGANKLMENLNNSIEDLKNKISQAEEEKEKTERNISLLEKQNEELGMKYERLKSENFHNQIELEYTRKKIADLKEELDNMNKEARSNQYEQFKMTGFKNQFGMGLKADAGRINQLIEEKKCLCTSILIVNKKLNKLKKEVAMYCLKGEYTLDRFGKLVDKTKKTAKFVAA